MRTIVTAGHVDHGKSTLVRALTGMDPDRLAEEKTRGLTIDLGFAWTVLGNDDRSGQLPGEATQAGGSIERGTESGTEIAFIDVPGHARFVKNMVAGVGGVAGCLFVVSAAEGWMPQSEEHLRILELVGLKAGVIALSRAGSVGPERRMAARSAIAGAVAGSFLQSAPVIDTDAPTGHGLHELRRALHSLLALQPPPQDTQRPRLWLDRAFHVRGAGTVVTGTLSGGSIDVGDSLALVGPGGAPVTVRVRRLEALGQPRRNAAPGERVACNVTGAGKRSPVRGDALVRPGAFQMSACFDTMLRVLPSLGHPLTTRGAFTVHIGSGEYPAKLSLLGDLRLIEPGRSAGVRVRVSVPLPLSLGDRFVVRESGRNETLGGGTMIDVAPVRSVSKARPAGTVDGIIAERGFLDAGELWRQTGELRSPTVGQFVASPDALADRLSSLTNRLRSAGSTGLELAELAELDRGLVHGVDGVSVSFGRAMMPASSVSPRTTDSWLESLREAPFAPAPPVGTTRGQLRELVQSGVVVEARGIHFAGSAVEEATDRLQLLLCESPDGITLGELRTVLGTSRRYALALLEHFDATGVTRRRGDVRVAGPQLAKRAGPELAEPDARRGESKADGLRETRGRPHGQQEQRVP